MKVNSIEDMSPKNGPKVIAVEHALVNGLIKHKGMEKNLKEKTRQQDKVSLNKSAEKNVPVLRSRKPKQDMSMEERLKEILPSTSTASQDSRTSTQTMATLLVQGLHGADRVIVDQVLDVDDTKVIRETVAQLQVSAVVPLIRELSTRLKTHKHVSPLVRWLRVVLSEHQSYLTAHPDLKTEVGQICQSLDNRLQLFDRVLRLNAKIAFIFEETARRGTSNNYAAQPAKLVYEESSDEDISDANEDHFSEMEDEKWEALDSTSENESGDDAADQHASSVADEESGGEDDEEEDGGNQEDNALDEAGDSSGESEQKTMFKRTRRKRKLSSKSSDSDSDLNYDD